MPDKELGSYLNHHLAGSVAGLETLEHLEAAERGTPMARELTELRSQGAADRQVLVDLMTRLKVPERETEKATAWLGEKVFRLMMPLREQKKGPLNLLLTLEALGLGLEGRRSLWVALADAAPETAALQGIDYQLMISRAEDQRARVEKLRLQAARMAFHHHAT
jgi:hypothetical protein